MLALLEEGRDKDIDFVVALLRHRLLVADDVKELAERLRAPAREVVLRNLGLCQART